MTNRLYSIFTETNTLKILGYLVEHPGREFIEKEIQKATSISKGGVNSAEGVEQIVKKSSLRDKLQLIIRTPTGVAELEKKYNGPQNSDGMLRYW